MKTSLIMGWAAAVGFEVSDEQEHGVAVLVAVTVHRHKIDDGFDVEQLLRRAAVEPLEIGRLLIECGQQIQGAADVGLEKAVVCAVPGRRLTKPKELFRRQRKSKGRGEEEP